MHRVVPGTSISTRSTALSRRTAGGDDGEYLAA
jgi:hypothetical protein